MSKAPSCNRPNCQNKAYRKDGLCAKHAYQQGKLHPKHPVEEAQNIIQHLTDNGWSMRTIAKASGLTYVCLSHITRGANKATHHATIRSLQNLPTTPPSHIGYIPSWPYERRLQSLQAAGYSAAKLTEISGLSRALICKITLNRADWVSPETAKKLTAMWENLATKPVIGPPTKTATRRLWETPMMWDDIDDPNEQHPEPRTLIQLTKRELGFAESILDYYENKPWPLKRQRRTFRRLVESGHTTSPTLRLIYREYTRVLTERSREARKRKTIGQAA